MKTIYRIAFALALLAPATARAQTYGGNPNSGGGANYTAGAGITISGGVIGANAQYGPDTTIPLLDSSSASVPAFEQITTLTSTTPGATTSQLVGKMMNAGAQTQVWQLSPTGMLAPNGSSSVPGYGFIGKPAYGMSYSSSLDGDVFLVNGGIQMGITTSLLMLYSSSARLSWGTGQTEYIQRSGLSLSFNANNTEKMNLANGGISFFGGAVAPQQTGGAATASASYTSTEQGMINRMYTALRAYGLLN